MRRFGLLLLVLAVLRFALRQLPDPFGFYIFIYGLVFLFALNLGLTVTHVAGRRRWIWEQRTKRG